MNFHGTGALFMATILMAGGAHGKEIPWNLEQLSQAPKTHAAPAFSEPGVQALFYETLSWKGKPTRAFAWMGMPERKPGEKVPGIVLVHGGGGTAFAEWVRLWTKRGYAAIAMDTCGATPGGEHGKRPRHEWSGPPGWGGFDQIDQPLEDQWTYHAIADVLLAHSLLRAQPDVDTNRIGITGISWGGYLTCIAAGVDNRFQFAVPVYGCGFLGEDSTWKGTLDGMRERGQKWLRLWDPSVYLPHAKMPFLWVTGTNDFAYPLNSHQKSYRAAPGPDTLTIRLRMPHGHGGPGENPEEIRAFADSIVNGAAPLAKITQSGRDGNSAWAVFDSKTPIIKAELLFTKAGGPWKDRLWESTPALIEGRKASATVPDGATAWFINVVDEKKHLVSSDMAQAN
jgi:dienelactone hydrolase